MRRDRPERRSTLRARVVVTRERHKLDTDVRIIRPQIGCVFGEVRAPWLATGVHRSLRSPAGGSWPIPVKENNQPQPSKLPSCIFWFGEFHFNIYISPALMSGENEKTLQSSFKTLQSMCWSLVPCHVHKSYLMAHDLYILRNGNISLRRLGHTSYHLW